MKQLSFFVAIFFLGATQAMEKNKVVLPTEEEIEQQCLKAIKSYNPVKLHKTLEKTVTAAIITTDEGDILKDSSPYNSPPNSDYDDPALDENSTISIERITQIAKSSSILGVEKYMALMEQTKQQIEKQKNKMDLSKWQRILKRLKKVKDPGKLGLVIASTSIYTLYKTFSSLDGAIDEASEVVLLINGFLTSGVGAYQVYNEYLTNKTTQEKLDRALAMLYILQNNLSEVSESSGSSHGGSQISNELQSDS